MNKLENLRKKQAFKRLNDMIKLTARPTLIGYEYDQENNQYFFSDSYRIYILNDKLDSKPMQGNYNLKNLYNAYEKKINDFEINIDVNLILDNHKNKIDFYEIDENLKFNNNFLKDTIDLLGKNVRYFLTADNKGMLVINNNNEKAFILGMVKGG